MMSTMEWPDWDREFRDLAAAAGDPVPDEAGVPFDFSGVDLGNVSFRDRLKDAFGALPDATLEFPPQDDNGT
jgi:hypothetical protein